MRSKLSLSLFINGFTSTLFYIQNNIIFLEQKVLNVLFMYQNFIQTFQTDLVYSSTQSCLVINNSCSADYPVFYQFQFYKVLQCQRKHNGYLLRTPETCLRIFEVYRTYMLQERIYNLFSM